ncbi:MAG: carbohydrate ABC transporter permease [Candidatus Goldbacteria bacterium]|nr:carbohydrate ABC transporter permease [Candidatus Goldiibacteriota bacterium]
MNEAKIKKIMVITGCAAAVVICLLPFIYMAVISLLDTDKLFSGTGVYVTFSNYINVISGENLHFPEYLKNSILISLLSSFFTVLIAALAAYAVARLNIAGKTLILLAVLCLSLFPQISIAGYIFKILSAIGLINTYSGLIFPYIAWSLPLCLWILTSYFMSVPKALDDAAGVDGANSLQILLYVILPVAIPGIVTSFLITFIFTLNEFLFALMFTMDHTARTVPVAIALFTGLHGELPWGDIMAAAAITTAPVIVIAAVFQKKIISGLTKGAVK